MNFNNYTIRSQEAVQQAQQLAQEMGHQQIENEHLFKAILSVDENVVPFILKKLQMNLTMIEQILTKELERFPKVTGADLMIAPETAKTLNEASIIAKNMNDEFVSIEHFLLAIFKSKSNRVQKRLITP